MNLGFMLLKKSGKQGSLKFFVTLLAAALGMLILLFVFSLTNALNKSFFERSSWVSAAFSTDSAPNSLPVARLLAPDAVVQTSTGEHPTFLGQNIAVFNMKFTGGTLPNASPLATYPANANEYYASPALTRLMDSYPSNVLRDRFAGKQVGQIPEASLSSPDQLVLIRGIDTASLSDTSSSAYLNAKRITDFTVSPFGKDVQERQKITQTAAMGIGAIGLIIPVMMLITTATALGSQEREKRYAALRLVGATKRQVRNITFVDSLAAAFLGITAGSVLFWLLRPILFEFRMQDMRLFPQDITVTPLVFCLIVAVIFLLVWLANARAIRQSVLSPLGVARQQKLKKSPKIWSVSLLVISAIGLSYFGSLSQERAYDLFGNNAMLYVLGLFVMMLLGILLAGSWLTKLYGWTLGKLYNSAKNMLVSRRIRYEARSTFRGIGGVVIAFFAGAFFITSLTTVGKLADVSTPLITRSLPDNSLMISYIVNGNGGSSNDVKKARDAAVQSGNYELDPVLVYAVSPPDGSNELNYNYLSCRDAERVFHTSCRAPGKYIKLSWNGEANMDNVVDAVPYIDEATKSTGDETVDGPVAVVNITEVYLPKPGKSVDVVAAEAVVTESIKQGGATVTIVNQALRDAGMGSVMASLKNLLYAGIIVTIIVASLNLVVATVAGLFDRKSSFFTLRLGGASLPFLKRVVVAESMLPLVFMSLISIACGMGAAYVFIRLGSSSLGSVFELPEVFFWVCVVAVFVLSYLGIRLILPMLGRLTTLDENRSE